MIGDFHIHSKYSHDSLMNLKGIVKISKKKGLDVIAITDHDTLRVAKKVKSFQNDFNINIIIGTEVSTDIGDIIGLHLIEPVKNHSWRDVIDEIKSQNGISILPHPYRGHTRDIVPIAKEVDLIEIYNGRSTVEQNKKAVDLAALLGKKITAGSDAHLYSEIGNVKIKVNSKLDGEEIIYTSFSTSWEKTSSQLFGYLRKRDQLWTCIQKGEITTLLNKGIQLILKNQP